MTPIEGPQSQLVYSTEPAQPGQRQEFRARTRITIHSIGVAAHLGSLGHEVESHIESRGSGRVYWTAPIAAERDANRYRETLRALDRAMKQHEQQIGPRAQQATEHERQ